MKNISKIGIIQTAPLPGDFSNNLRAIVQGYRECLDHGADIVIAPAAALCGLEPRALATRFSFLRQTQLALKTLSQELGDAPLILGAYTYTFGEDELTDAELGENDELDTPWMAKNLHVILTPYLLEKDEVTELEDCETVTIRGCSFYVDTSDQEMLAESNPDFMVHLPCTPWHIDAAEDDEQERQWEASMVNGTVITCRAVGTVGGNIYGGGSSLYSSQGKTELRLPFFEPASKVVDLSRPRPAHALPEKKELLSSALQRGIRDNVRNNGFTGVCLPMDHNDSALLAVLCIEALGSSNVCGVSFNPENKLADKLGISCFRPSIAALKEAAVAAMGGEDTPALQERLQTTLAITHADSRGLMLCTPLNRRELMLGEFCTYGRSGGQLAPLGNLYDIDIYLLCEYFSEKYADIFGKMNEPEQGMTNKIIHEMMDCNLAPSSLLRKGMNYAYKENEVRLIQRKILASGLKRAQLPIILHVDPQEYQLSFPITHRMND